MKVFTKFQQLHIFLYPVSPIPTISSELTDHLEAVLNQLIPGDVPWYVRKSVVVSSVIILQVMVSSKIGVLYFL